MVFVHFSFPWRSQIDQKSIKNQVKTGQDKPRQAKTGQASPRQPKTGPKTGPRQAPEAAKMAQTGPRASKTAPKRPQDGLQEASKKRIPPTLVWYWSPDAFKVHPGPLQGSSRTPPRYNFTAFLIDIWMALDDLLIDFEVRLLYMSCSPWHSLSRSLFHSLCLCIPQCSIFLACLVRSFCILLSWAND